MKTFLSLTLLLLASAIEVASQATSARAQSFTTAPNQQFYIDLDVEDGHASEWRHLDLGSISGLRASVSVLRLGKDPKYLPYFRICLVTNDSSFGLVINGTKGKPTVVISQLVTDKKTDGYSKTLALNEKIDVELDWSAPGKLKYRIGSDQIREIPVSGSFTRLDISASTGELLIDSLTLGRFAN